MVMNPVKSRCLIAVLLSWCIALARTAAAEEVIRIGVAEADITPPKGFPVAGYYHERLATGTHDPLKAKAIVFCGVREQAALVVCDLTGIAVDLSTEVRRRAAAKTKIPASNIIVTATHSHTAPDYITDLYEYLRADRKSPEKTNQAFAPKLIGGIVDAVVTAHARPQPSTLEAGTAQPNLPASSNRRFVMKDGSVRTWMHLDQPGVVRPAVPVHPQICLVL